MQDLTHIGVPAGVSVRNLTYVPIHHTDMQQGVVNKYGFMTETTGTIQVRFNVVTHSWSDRKQAIPGASMTTARRVLIVIILCVVGCSTNIGQAMEVFGALRQKKAQERAQAKVAELLKSQ